MKILFTGGGTGGHFYPIIAVVEAIEEIAEKEHLLMPQLFYVAPDPYDKNVLREHNITFLKAPAGKIRSYPSLKNFTDLFKTGWGTIRALWQMYRIFPDVVFSKGGYASFPTLMAARILRIPVVIHESDSSPGKTNKWAGEFAQSIAVSFPAATEYFPKDKVALTGNPIRHAIRNPQKKGAHEFLKLEQKVPVLLILGGSQGAQHINDVVIEVLPDLLDRYQVIHQTGDEHYESVKEVADVVLENHPNHDRYRPFGTLDTPALRMAAGIAGLVISRAGSTIFEIAAWGTPSIVIPISEDVSAHQTKNAYTYARSGAAVVVSDDNLTSSVLLSAVNRLMENEEERAEMGEAAKGFAKLDAAEKVARELLAIGLEHEA